MSGEKKITEHLKDVGQYQTVQIMCSKNSGKRRKKKNNYLKNNNWEFSKVNKRLQTTDPRTLENSKDTNQNTYHHIHICTAHTITFKTPRIKEKLLNAVREKQALYTA